MKTWILTAGLVLAGFGLGACTPTVSDSAACKALGLFGSKEECLALNTGVSCEMAPMTSNTTSKTILCWKPSSGGQGGGPFATPTATPACNGPAPDWTLGAWSPATCTPTTSQQTRDVTCGASCPCPTPSPVKTRPCSGDLYNGKHYSSQCTEIIGTMGARGVVSVYFSKRGCLIRWPACPNGWFPLLGDNGVPVTRTVCPGTTWCSHHAYYAAIPVEPGSIVTDVMCY